MISTESTNIIHIKKDIVRQNQKPFINKALRKAIMHRSRLHNIFNKLKNLRDWENYHKQWKFVLDCNKAQKESFKCQSE